MRTFMIPMDRLNTTLLDRYLTTILTALDKTGDASFSDMLATTITRDSIATWAEYGCGLSYDRFCQIFPDGDDLVMMLDPDGLISDVDAMSVNEAEVAYVDCVWCMYDQMHTYLHAAPEWVAELCTDVSEIHIDNGDIIIQEKEPPRRDATDFRDVSRNLLAQHRNRHTDGPVDSTGVVQAAIDRIRKGR